MNEALSPAQQQACNQILKMLPLLPVVGLTGPSGSGKTTILEHVRKQTGGEWVAAKELMRAMRTSHPLAIEETFERIVEAAIKDAEYVFIDDLSLLTKVVTNSCSFYPRNNFLNAAFESMTRTAVSLNCKLIFSSEHSQNELDKKGYSHPIPDFSTADYEFFCRTYLGPELAEFLDYKKIFRFARNLDAYDLKAVGILLRSEKNLNTDQYIEALRSFGLTSNVNLGEVQQVSLADLKGVDDVVRSLETNIILPLEQIELADQLGLKPKRGVLLAGPPGTGKTTVGRALAHRLKSKFFLIDGTCIAGTGNFYGQVAAIFEEAKHNAPAVIFIDDGDVIFEGGEELGLYRYLLTMLDGLESESSGQVCVMMTAMDVGNLPPALIRSGRIELWLELRLPDETARAAILNQMLQSLMELIGVVDVSRLAAVTGEFTGADLKRLVEDGKNLLAADKVQNAVLRPVTEYFLQAVESVRANKALYAQAEARALLRSGRSNGNVEPPHPSLLHFLAEGRS